MPQAPQPEQTTDQALQNLFSRSSDVVADHLQGRTTTPVFVGAVAANVRGARRRKLAKRVLLMVLVAFFLAPVQDVALVFTQVLMTSLLTVEDRLVAQLPAPVNTVGSLLSALMLLLRVFYLRVFR